MGNAAREQAGQINAPEKLFLIGLFGEQPLKRFTGAPRDLRGAVISLEACGDMPCGDLMAA